MISSHPGFDDKGKVTDAKTAAQTVKSIHQGFVSVRDAMNGTGKALREAVVKLMEKVTIAELCQRWRSLQQEPINPFDFTI